MALINGFYVFVEDESLDYDMEVTSHPVEDGIEITDHIRRKAVSISLSGKIVNYSDTVAYNDDRIKEVKAVQVLDAIRQLQRSGELITYVGRNVQNNLQIHSFSTSHPNTVWGGCEFDMTLKELRVAKPAYTEVKEEVKSVASGGTQQVEKGENEEVFHTVKKGDCIWNLVTKDYKTLKPTFPTVMEKCNWVMSKNPDAFSRKGDFRTLQIGKKLLIGLR